MSFLEILKKVMTNDKKTLKEPQFVKEFSSENKNISNLQELLKEVSDEETTNNIKNKINRLSYGLIGEKNVAYELKNSHMPILILHNLYLEFNGLTAQIDFVVVSEKFILVIECKNLVGEIDINNKGEFTRVFKTSTGKVYKKEGMYSPIVQNERHLELIKDILENEGFKRSKLDKAIDQISVVANEKAIINARFAKDKVKKRVIKHDHLIEKMKEISRKSTISFTEETMYKISNILLKYNKEYSIDYSKMYNIDKNEIEETKTSYDNEDNTEKISIEKTELYKELKKYRLNKSKEEMVKAYYLYTNVQLEEIVKLKPKTLNELANINGFGKVKCEKYGRDIIDIVKKYN
ncbi:MAG: NERD domain-containing protein [Clostridium sp.]|nr:NERD domain-containing protein [Clostridium sp.]